MQPTQKLANGIAGSKLSRVKSGGECNTMMTDSLSLIGFLYRKQKIELVGLYIRDRTFRKISYLFAPGIFTSSVGSLESA